MGDHYFKVKVQLERQRNIGRHKDREQEPESGPSVFPGPSTNITNTTSTKSTSKSKGRRRGHLQRDELKYCGVSDVSVSANAVRGLRQLGYELTANLKGSPRKILEVSAERNGNNGKTGVSKSFQETFLEDEVKVEKKRRAVTAVTVNTSKAKSSLEALRKSIKQLNWEEFHLGRQAACDIHWHAFSFHDNENVVSGQVNQFPGMVEMLRKINVSRAIRTMQEIFPEEYNFYPRFWILPDEYEQFSTQIQRVKENHTSVNPTFIFKPDRGSQGGGIYLIQNLGDLKLVSGSPARKGIVQEYIQKPLLIDELKFDIRLYVLIKSLEPLEVYIAKEGLTRFCTEPYQTPCQKNLSHVFMHLTNYSLNVHSCNFMHSDSQSTGSKRTLSRVLEKLAAEGVNIKKVWSDIIALVIKTVMAVVPELKVFYQAENPEPTCFQILGFDILLMKNFEPVLLEVNANPSMRIDHAQEMAPGVFEFIPSPVDEEVKVAVIRDTLRLMNAGPEKRTIFESSPEKSGALPPLCLRQVYPKYTKQFRRLRLLERISSLFIRFLRVNDKMRLSLAAFHTFVRTCKLSSINFPMVSAAQLYSDTTRPLSGAAGNAREEGMGLQAFVEAFLKLSRSRFKSPSLKEKVVALLDQCVAQLGPKHTAGVGSIARLQPDGKKKKKKPPQPAPNRPLTVSCSRALPQPNQPQAAARQHPLSHQGSLQLRPPPTSQATAVLSPSQHGNKDN